MELSATEKSENKINPVKRDVKVTPVGVRASLPESTAEKVQKTLLGLKERGADVKADDLLGEIFLKVDEAYLSRQLEHFTPASYYLTKAAEHPELLLRLIQKAKQGISLLERGEKFVVRRKPRSKIPKASGVDHVGT